MRKKQIVVAISAAVLSAVLLFGGWTVYDKVAVAAPIERAVSGLPDVIKADKPVMGREQVKIGLELSDSANIREIYNAINKDAADAIDGRKLQLDVQSAKDEQLEELWQSALFAVAQAMETKSYSDIPGAMEQAAQPYENVTVSTEMDEDNVYITMKNGKSVKIAVLPRVPVQLEVWSNA